MFQHNKFQWRSGKSVIWQLLGLLSAWIYIIALHIDNDGLWYQGDSPRHAANGLFWWDFLSNFPVHPVKFAYNFYEHYPVINPTTYPPLFYIVEGFTFSLFGPSPHLAKLLVSIFAFVAGAYLVAWLRRWVSSEAGWVGVLLLLQPGMIMWSNAVMLNMPSMAMGLAALYHARRWLDAAGTRHHAYLASVFSIIGILVYFPTGVVVFIISAWVLAEGHWRAILDRRKWWLLGLFTALLLPSAMLLKTWSPAHFSNLLGPFRRGLYPQQTFYYLEHVDEIISPITLLVSLLGIVVGICMKSWRGEAKFLLIWSAVVVGVFSYMWFKEARYILLLIPPVIILATMGMYCLSQWYAAVFHRPRGALFFLALGLLVILHVLIAPLVVFPNIKGYTEVAGFLKTVSPRGTFFYDGRYDGVFSFYLRATDPRLERRVVLGDKLIYNRAFLRERKEEYANSPADVVKILRSQCGCQWLAVEKRGSSSWIATARYLREALKGPEFQLVKSFPIHAPQPTRIDIYRFLPNVPAG